MSNGEKILVIGRHQDLLEKITAKLIHHGYQVVGVLENQQALDAFTQIQFNLVVIGGGVDHESRQLFHTEFQRIQPGIPIIVAHPWSILHDIKKALKS
jgi:DNA-binding NtrC family response regulator